MKLPNHERATIARTKIEDYLLSPTHSVGRGKAKFFARFGFTRDSWEVLATALMDHAAEHNLSTIEDSPFGVRYVIEGAIHSPDERNPVIRTVWFVDEGDNTPRFVTAYPLRVAEENNDE